MATIILGSCNLISRIKCSKGLPIRRLLISKSTTTMSFQGRPPSVVGIVTSGQVRRDFLLYCVQPGNLPPTGDSVSSWKQLIFEIITTMIIPFFTRKWTNLLKIKDEVDTVIEGTEKIADYVEEVAETVDKVVKDVADHLPESGKWRDAAVFVEGVAEEIEREAHLVEDFLHKVEEVEDKLELLVESVKDQTKNVHEDSNT